MARGDSWVNCTVGFGSFGNDRFSSSSACWVEVRDVSEMTSSREDISWKLSLPFLMKETASLRMDILSNLSLASRVIGKSMAISENMEHSVALLTRAASRDLAFLFSEFFRVFGLVTCPDMVLTGLSMMSFDVCHSSDQQVRWRMAMIDGG